jgi:hypothetical protein
MSFSALAAAVRTRAGDRCEYCRMHQSLQGATFHVEHIVPASQQGSSSLDNLAWCCPSCNLYKSDRVMALDPKTGQLTPLFHPRRDQWTEHFAWSGYTLVGRTPAGRGTIALLNLNSERRLAIRRAEERFKLFPPAE